MRLLHARELTFKEFHRDPPRYIILSHRWNDIEASQADIELVPRDPEVTRKAICFAQYVCTRFPHISWIWLDSCCVNQNSAAELSEAVNLMFDWYRGAELCVAYLADVASNESHTKKDAKSWADTSMGSRSVPGAPSAAHTPHTDFLRSVWFTRGWTLQELLASRLIVFVSKEWELVGHKGRVAGIDDCGPNLENLIAGRTGIPELVLLEYENSRHVTTAEKMKWMEGRETLREEDLSYAMYGLFGVTPGANYGEKKAGARQRLLAAIAERERLHGLSSLSDSKPNAIPVINTVPFQRDPEFVTRHELDLIDEKLRIPGARVAVVGFGGVGKSQLAIEHSYRVRDRFPNRTIIWIHASSAARWNDDLQVLAKRLDLPGRTDKHVNLLALISTWLADVRNGEWLLILDNADKADFLFEPMAEETLHNSSSRKTAPVQYLPVCSHGTLLMTTRRHTVAEQLIDQSNIISLQPSKAHAEALIVAKVQHVSNADIQALSQALDYVPLAIAQAAAYIRKRSPRCTVRDYLAKLVRSEKSQSSLLKVESNELRRDREEASNSILLTWQVSFEHIRQQRQSATNLLALMSFYDHQGIPDSLVRPDISTQLHEPEATSEDSEHDESFADPIEAFEEDVEYLRDYCFLSVVDGSTFEMHHLVQLAARLWLKSSSTEEELWATESLRRLVGAFPRPSFHDWPRCRMLYPHAKLVINRVFTHGIAPAWQSDLLQRAAGFAFTQGLYADAETLALKCLQLEESALIQRDFFPTTAWNVLASLYRERGDYEAAEALDRKSLAEKERIGGPEHINTLRYKENLAVTIHKQGKDEEAIKMVEEIVVVCQRVYGLQHLETLNIMSLYAMLMSGQDSSRAIELQLCQQVLDEGQMVLKATEPIVTNILENLSSAYYQQRDWNKAEQLSKEIMQRRTDVLGPKHPSTLKVMYGLAEIYRKQRRYSEAEKLHQVVYKQRQAVLGATHPKVWKSLAAIANVLDSDRQYERALELYQEAAAGYTDALGPQHADTQGCIRDMKTTLRHVQRRQHTERGMLYEEDLSHQSPGPRLEPSWIE